MYMLPVLVLVLDKHQQGELRGNTRMHAQHPLHVPVLLKPSQGGNKKTIQNTYGAQHTPAVGAYKQWAFSHVNPFLSLSLHVVSSSRCGSGVRSTGSE